MSLVDAQTLWLLGPGMLEGVALICGRIPEDSVVDWRDVEILHDSLDPYWEAIDALSTGQNHGDLSDR